jgi:hypothetical protein
MQITVTLTLVIDVPDEEQKKYYLNEDGTPTVDVIADIFDSLDSVDPLISVNGKTKQEIQQLLQAKVF